MRAMILLQGKDDIFHCAVKKSLRIATALLCAAPLCMPASLCCAEDGVREEDMRRAEEAIQPVKGGRGGMVDINVSGKHGVKVNYDMVKQRNRKKARRAEKEKKKQQAAQEEGQDVSREKEDPGQTAENA